MKHITAHSSAAAMSHPAGFTDRPSKNPHLPRPAGNLYDERLKRDVERGYTAFWERRGVIHPNPEREPAFIGFNKALL